MKTSSKYEMDPSGIEPPRTSRRNAPSRTTIASPRQRRRAAHACQFIKPRFLAKPHGPSRNRTCLRMPRCPGRQRANSKRPKTGTAGANTRETSGRAVLGRSHPCRGHHRPVHSVKLAPHALRRPNAPRRCWLLEASGRLRLGLRVDEALGVRAEVEAGIVCAALLGVVGDLAYSV